MVRTGPRANTATGAFGGDPYGATNRVRGVPKWGPLGGVDACNRGHWSLRWSSLWGHEPCEGCAKIGGGTHADPPPGAFGGAPYGATHRVRCVPEWARSPMRTLPLGPLVELPRGGTKRVRVCRRGEGYHANPATWAFGADPLGATKRVRSLPKWRGSPCEPCY